MALPGLRLACLARRILDGRQSDGLIDRPQSLARRRVCTTHVLVTVQDARARAARLVEGLARYGRTADHAPDRAARQVALMPAASEPRERHSTEGTIMNTRPDDPIQLLA